MQILFFLLFTAVSCLSNEKSLLRVPLERHDPILASRLNKRTGAMTTLYNDFGAQYLITVGIGSPAQNFTVTLDTGSADLWVPGNACPSQECPNLLFEPSQSSTYQPLNQPLTLAYGIGNVNGTYATDTVTVAGISVSDQPFGLAVSTQNILTHPSTITVANQARLAHRAVDKVTANGILGLGYPQLTASFSKSQKAYTPFVFNLVAQDIIQEPVFSVYMNEASRGGWAGEIIFGGVDPTKFRGNLTYLPVVSLKSVSKTKRASLATDGKYYWMVDAHAVAIAGNTPLPFNTTSAFILDTGTTLTYLPQPMAEAILDTVAGHGRYSLEPHSTTYLVDCAVAHTSLHLEWFMTDEHHQTIRFSIPASQLILPIGGTLATAKSCLFGIAPSTPGTNLHLLGDSVLRSAYLVFDMANNKVGIAPAIGLNGNVQASSFSFQSAAQLLSPSLWLPLALVFFSFSFFSFSSFSFSF